jgi:predicted enzyme related to lactoylglutathione lyase
MRVIGIGGIFMKCRDVEGTKAWYEKHLGIPMESWGAVFPFKNDPNPDAYGNLSFFREDSTYLTPSGSRFMINFRVENLDALVTQLSKDGIPLIGTPEDTEFGKFAWIMDPEGNKIELWEQPI